MKKIFTKSLKKWFTLVEMMLVIAILGIFFAIVSQFDFSSRVNQEKAANFAHYIADIIRDARHDAMVGRMDADRMGFSERRLFIDIGTNLALIWVSNFWYHDYFSWVDDNIHMSDNINANSSLWNIPIITIEYEISKDSKIFHSLNGFDLWDQNFKIKEVYMSTQWFSNNIDKLEFDGYRWSKASSLKIYFSNHGITSDWEVFEEYSGALIESSNCMSNKCIQVRGGGAPLSWVRTFKIVVEYKGFKRYIYGDILSGAIYVLNSESK